MDQKTTMEKLQILLPHWIEHNHNHEAEFKKWADLARAEGQGAQKNLQLFLRRFLVHLSPFLLSGSR